MVTLRDISITRSRIIAASEDVYEESQVLCHRGTSLKTLIRRHYLPSLRYLNGCPELRFG